MRLARSARSRDPEPPTPSRRARHRAKAAAGPPAAGNHATMSDLTGFSGSRRTGFAPAHGAFMIAVTFPHISPMQPGPGADGDGAVDPVTGGKPASGAPQVAGSLRRNGAPWRRAGRWCREAAAAGRGRTPGSCAAAPAAAPAARPARYDRVAGSSDEPASKTNNGTSSPAPSRASTPRTCATVAAATSSRGPIRRASTGQVHESPAKFSWLTF